MSSKFCLQEHGLYYDGNSGCYYKYDQAADKFEFHSQVYVEQPTEIVEPELSSKKVRQMSQRTAWNWQKSSFYFLFLGL